MTRRFFFFLSVLTFITVCFRIPLLLLNLQPFALGPALHVLVLGIAADGFSAGIIFLLYFLATLRGGIGIVRWVLVLLLNLYLLIYAFDLGYFVWAKTHIDMVFVHNMFEFEALSAILRTIVSDYGPRIPLFVFGVAVSVFVAFNYTLRWWLRRSHTVVTGKWHIAGMIIVFGLAMYADEFANKYFPIQDYKIEKLRRSPLIELGNEFVRKLQIRREISFAKAQAARGEMLRYYEQAGIEFDPVLQEQGYWLARKHTDACFTRGDCFSPMAGKRPNIIVISVESLSAAAVKSLSGHTWDTTPFIDGLRDKSVFFTNHYANSCQTPTGIVATICSAYPNFGGRITRTDMAGPLLCLPDILKKESYATAYFMGDTLNYDRMDNFVHHHSFDRIFSLDSDPENPMRGPWGLHDEVVAKAALDYIAGRAQERNPFFLLFVTSSNHPPFSLPKADFEHFTAAEVGERKNFFNTVRYSDHVLGQFITGVQDLQLARETVFIITADHSVDFEGNGYDLFHAPIKRNNVWIPLIIHAPGLLAAQTIAGVTSQVDLIPSLLTLLHMDIPNAFVGRNIFARQNLESNVALYFNHYMDNLVVMVQGNSMLRFHLPNFRGALRIPDDAPVEAGDIAPQQAFVNSLFLTYNYLLYNLQLWNKTVL